MKKTIKKLKRPLLFACKGCGSAIAESFFTLAKIKFDRKEVDYSTESAERRELIYYNPLCQVPTIVLPNGEILTETLAIAHFVNAVNPKAQLIPKNKKDLAKFLRWSTYIVAAIYPTWTYGDDPKKWVGSEAAEKLRQSTDDHRMKLWQDVEKHASQPYFLGKKLSAIDIYIAIMTYWRPRTDWFEKNCPKLFKIAIRVRKDSKLKAVFKLNFSDTP